MRSHPYAFMLFLCLCLLPACSASNEAGEAYPNRLITYSIPFMPGGQSDVDARRQIPYLQEQLGQNVNITYKAGAGGAIGWTELVNQQPDEYFIAGFNVPHIILQPMTNEDTGYETEQIQPVALFQRTPIGLAVSKESGIETLEEFIRLAQKEAITVSGTGTYTGTHLLSLELALEENLNLIYVPSPGASESIQSILGGTTTAVLANSPDLVSYQDDFTILAIGSEKRFPSLPEVPTFLECGLNITASIERGVAVPPGTDDDIIRTLEKAFLSITENEKIRQEMMAEGFEPLSMGSDESRAYIEEQSIKLEKTLRRVGEID